MVTKHCQVTCLCHYTHMHTQAQNEHESIHAGMQARRHAGTQARTHTSTLARTHARTHTNTHAQHLLWIQITVKVNKKNKSPFLWILRIIYVVFIFNNKIIKSDNHSLNNFSLAYISSSIRPKRVNPGAQWLLIIISRTECLVCGINRRYMGDYGVPYVSLACSKTGIITSTFLSAFPKQTRFYGPNEARD